MKAELKKYLKNQRLCPRDLPLLRLGFCPKQKGSCFSKKGNGCPYTGFPLIQFSDLSDSLKTLIEAHTAKQGKKTSENRSKKRQKV